jgi:hypothetical protein
VLCTPVGAQPIADEWVFLIKNGGNQPKTFVLEPWGEVYPMAPGASFRVIVVGPKGEPDVVMGDAAITFFAWAGTTAIVKQDGKDLSQGAGKPPVPGIPPGKSGASWTTSV